MGDGKNHISMTFGLLNSIHNANFVGNLFVYISLY